MNQPNQSVTLVQRFTGRGERMTPQRRVILETLDAISVDIDAGTLIRLAKQRDPSINRATVYRTMDLLRKMKLMGAGDAVRLVCSGCGNIEGAAHSALADLRQQIERERQFQIAAIRAEISGLCAQCVENGSKSQ